MTSAVTLLLTALYLVLPGLLLALVVRLPAVVAIGTAPVLTFGAVALLPRVTSATGLAWEPLTFVVELLLSAMLLWALRALVRSRRAQRLSFSAFPGPA